MGRTPAPAPGVPARATGPSARGDRWRSPRRPAPCAARIPSPWAGPWTALALGGMPDHVHLFVALSNTIPLAQLMKDVKDALSRFVSETPQPGHWFAWQPNCGAFSVSARDKKSVIAYIGNQK